MISQSITGFRAIPQGAALRLNTLHPLYNGLHIAVVGGGSEGRELVHDTKLITPFTSVPIGTAGTVTGLLGYRRIDTNDASARIQVAGEPTFLNQKKLSICIIIDTNTDGGNTRYFFSERLADNSIQMDIGQGGGNYFCSAIGSGTNQPIGRAAKMHEYACLIFTVDTDADVYKFYINGKFEAQTTNASNAFGTGSYNPPTLLALSNNSSHTASSIIACYTWRGRILTQEEAHYLTNNPLGLLKAPQLLRWDYFQAAALNYTFSDNINNLLDDALIINVGNQAFSDSISITDAASISIPIILVTDDSFTILDSFNQDILGFIDLPVSDNFAVDDVLSMAVAVQLIAGETLAFSDTFVYSLNNFIVIQTEDALFLFDSFRFSERDRYGLSDVVAVVDAPTVQMSMNLAFGDDFSITDSALGVAPPTVLTLQLGELLSLSDTPGMGIVSSFASSLRRYLNDVPSPRT